MKKHYLLFLLTITGVINILPQVVDDATEVRLHVVSMDVVHEETKAQDFIEFDELEFDDTEINMEELIPFWARVANKIVAPFFVWYAQFNKWWQSRRMLHASESNPQMPHDQY